MDNSRHRVTVSEMVADVRAIPIRNDLDRFEIHCGELQQHERVDQGDTGEVDLFRMADDITLPGAGFGIFRAPLAATARRPGRPSRGPAYRSAAGSMTIGCW